MKFFNRSTERSKHDCFENKDLTVYQNLGICLSIKKKAKKKEGNFGGFRNICVEKSPCIFGGRQHMGYPSLKTWLN